MLRPALSILIGAVLALLLSATAQFLLLQLSGPTGLGAARVVGLVVFWAVMLLVVVTIARGSRASRR